MHLVFTKEEKKWIDMELFNWTIKKGCPKDIKKEIEKKLELLNGKE